MEFAPPRLYYILIVSMHDALRAAVVHGTGGEPSVVTVGRQ